MALIDDIQCAINQMAKAIGTGRIDAVMELYTWDACLLAGNEPILVGKDAIRPYIERLFARGINLANFQTVHVEELNEVVLENGCYSMSVQPEGGTPQCLASGSYILVWKRDRSGQWRIHRDAFSVLSPS
ncbi:nuclear transport factor 2 family protein [Pseudomonas sp. SIMBA_077]